MPDIRLVYSFGGDTADGCRDMTDLLGGKGANLAEMVSALHLPVPAGFTITTDVCRHYRSSDRLLPPELDAQVREAMARIETVMGRLFGSVQDPLLVSVRSGSRRSMPGMMETVLNVGLCPATLPGLAARAGDVAFAHECYRRFLAMYADVVMEKTADTRPAEGEAIRQQLDRLRAAMLLQYGLDAEDEAPVAVLEAITRAYQARIAEVFGRRVPDDPWEQLWGAIGAVFASWGGRRAVAYRRLEDIPDDWGTAVNVQAMVYGNLRPNSLTGVAFTRNPATGENVLYGEWLPEAQGEDIVAGIRTPFPLNAASRNAQNAHLPTMQDTAPHAYAEIQAHCDALEAHFNDMQDVEFTVENGRLWLLQTRSGKRSGLAALAIALDMLHANQIEPTTAVLRVHPSQLESLLHPLIDPVAAVRAERLADGLPAGPGAVCGEIVFTAADAVAAARQERSVILVREETSPEDVAGMAAAKGILTAKGGMTSHAALVSRGWGKCCVVGAGALTIDATARTVSAGDRVLRERDVVTLDGTNGHVYVGDVKRQDVSEDPRLHELLEIADRHRRLKVRANADTPSDARAALARGAEGIGLLRTEHMFYGSGSEEPLFLLRRAIAASTPDQRLDALNALLPHVRRDIASTLEAMAGMPVTIRLLDPPLHEFLPKSADGRARLAAALDLSDTEMEARIAQLAEVNPMMGNRGVRLGITVPEITKMQVRAVFEAAAELLARDLPPHLEIMIPVTALPSELQHQRALVASVHARVCEELGIDRIPHALGTMIEVPRAALVADALAEEAEFFSFGTNDLTQLTFGFSRDDAASFLPAYLDAHLLRADPFQVLDQPAVGALMAIAVEKGRGQRPGLEIGICGEHAAEASTVAFCARIGMDYVSCSPYRVPVARLAAAQAAIRADAEA